MADTKILQTTVHNNVVKRLHSQPEKVNQKLSDSKILALLLDEALNAREAKKSKK